MNAFILHDRYVDPEAGRISSYFSQLFIIIGAESLQYAVFDTEKNAFIALADYRMAAPPRNSGTFFSQLEQLFSVEEMLLKKYPSVVIGIETPFQTLVPSPLFDAGQLKQYLEFNFRLPEGCQISSDHMEEIDAYHVYGFLPGLKDTIKKYFRETALFHRSSALIRAAYYYHKNNPGPSGVFLHVRDHYIDLVVLEGNRLAFFNAFPCRTREDMLYFTLFALEQLNLHPDTARLFLSGMINAGSDSYLLLEQYIRSISFTGRPGSFNYSPIFNQLPLHRYQELFALALCGS
jgi:hypothetical protein